MQIGELAKRAGVSVQTIRFYERQELLPEPQLVERAAAPLATAISSQLR